MTPGDYQQLKRQFALACELPEGERGAFVQKSFPNDPGLQRELNSLLDAHQEITLITSETPLRKPPAGAPSTRHSSQQSVRFLHRAVLSLGFTSYPQRHWRIAMLAVPLLILLSTAWLQHRLYRTSAEKLRRSLTAIADSQAALMEAWIERTLNQVSAYAENETLQKAVQDLMAIKARSPGDAAALRESAAAATVANVMRLYETAAKPLRFAVCDYGATTLASSRPEMIGVQAQAKAYAESMRVLKGETYFSPPRPESDFTSLPLRDTNFPVVFAVAPISNPDKQIVAGLVVPYPAIDDFSAILKMFASELEADSFAFDKDGLMISDSRQTQRLRELGLVPKDSAYGSIFQVHLRDPGGDLSTGFRSSLPRPAQPLTRMAALAIAGKDGADVDGYRNHSGQHVVGAWHWLAKYEFGVGVEVPYAAAYSLERQLTWMLWSAAILSSLALGILLSVAPGMLMRRYALAMTDGLVGQYRLGDKIGEGGSSEVYRAQHTFMLRPAAIKLFRNAPFSASGSTRYEREAKLASQLQHPNTIELYDCGIGADGRFFIAMELLNGLTLRQIQKRCGRIPANRVLFWLRQVCASLREAHARGLVHRDIKPQNVIACQLGGEYDFIKVLDFGLVKSFEDRGQTVTGEFGILGTPLYLAPERFREPALVDPRIDVYAVGILGYQLLVGKPPFTANNPADLMDMILRQPPRPMSSQVDDRVPVELELLLLRCLEKDSALRPAHAGELYDLMSALHVEPPWTSADAQAWWENVPPAAPSEEGSLG